MQPTSEDVLAALRSVIDPDLRRDIVTLGFVKDVRTAPGEVYAKIELTTPACPVKDELKAQAESFLKALPGVERVEVEMTARVRQRSTPPADLLPGVKHIVAIASGKGGVGKSTVTVNLAVALAQTGATVGILDADVYGPSIPMMLGAEKERPYQQDEKIVPLLRYGVSVMSIGFLLEEGQAVLWRGPMVAGTVRQLLADVAWGELDYLLVDLPPGTGDAPMSLAQLVPLTGVVVVSTPHNVAANIAGKAVGLFRRLNAPVLGVVENMGPSIDPITGEERRFFSGLPGSELAQNLKAPYLGSIPFDPEVSASGDEGYPSVISRPHTPQAESFRQIAGALARQCSIKAMTRNDAISLDAAQPPRA